MACKPKALILGHSFARRFQLFFDQGVDHRTVPGLNLSSVDIHFEGVGGRTVSKMFAYDLEYVKFRLDLDWFTFLLHILINDGVDVWVTQPLFIPLLHFSLFPHLLITHYSFIQLLLQPLHILPTNLFVTQLRISFHWWDIIATIIS